MKFNKFRQTSFLQQSRTIFCILLQSQNTQNYIYTLLSVFYPKLSYLDNVEQI